MCVGSPKNQKDQRVYIQSQDFNLAVLFQSGPLCNEGQGRRIF